MPFLAQGLMIRPDGSLNEGAARERLFFFFSFSENVSVLPAASDTNVPGHSGSSLKDVLFAVAQNS